MTSIRFEQFGGIAPIQDPHKLNPRLASAASDVRLEGGDLRPLSAPVAHETLGFVAGHLHKYRPFDSNVWLAWPEALDVDVVRSPIPEDQFGRIYWSCLGAANDYPRMASQPTTADIMADSGSVRRLGVPSPDAAPATTEVYSDASAMIATISQAAPAVVQVSGTQPFENGQTVKVLIYPDGNPDNATDNMVEIDSKTFVVTDCDATSFTLLGSDTTKDSAFVTAGVAKVVRVYQDSDLESRSYVYTFVTDFGEEGPPSPPSVVSDFRYDSGVQVSASFSVVAGYAGINRVRVYRIVAGTGVADPLFTKELGVTVAGSAGSFSVLDDTEAVALGESLATEDWAPPPIGLDGFTLLPCGSIAAFKDNTLYFSEPYMPHAWPARYRRTVNFDITGIAVVSETLVVGTSGKPSVAVGSAPDSLSIQELDVYAPALTKRGMCNIGSGVLYASSEGIVLVTSSGAQVLTSKLFGKRDWLAAWDTTMSAIFNDHHCLLLSDSTAKDSLLLYLNDGTLDVCPLSLRGRAPEFDPSDNTVSFLSASDHKTRMQYDAGTPIPYTWTSAIVSLAYDANLACGRVTATTYPVTLTVRRSSYGAARPDTEWSLAVADANPFRLPDGFLSREWQIRITGTSAVQAAVLAENMDELA